MKRTKCPLCYSKRLEKNYYKIPFRKINEFTVEGYNTSYFPYVESELHIYSKCADCESIFIDPVDMSYWNVEDKARLKDDSKIKKAKEKWNWPTYQAIVDKVEKYVSGKDLIMDIACGSGQCLTVMKEKGISYKQMIGIDLEENFINYVKEQGFIGLTGDFTKMDLSKYFGKTNAIIFAEAMEHSFSPKGCIEIFEKLLKSNGILYFTVQNNGRATPVKKGENMFASERAVNGIMSNFKKLELINTGDRWIGIYKYAHLP